MSAGAARYDHSTYRVIDASTFDRRWRSFSYHPHGITPVGRALPLILESTMSYFCTCAREVLA